VTLEHAGGANGTRLNGRPIDKPEPLSDGDEIGIGEVTLKVSFINKQGGASGAPP
jgi:pSer/pThr/pTyr-binding forkhead associated (FHA) protein